MNPFDASDGAFLVLANTAGQYSLWPSDVRPPAGWVVRHGPAERQDCLDLIDTLWPEGESAPLSLQQRFLLGLDKGDEDGSCGTGHVLGAGLRLSGPVEAPVLRRALDALVERHETLRTLLVGENGERTPLVCPTSAVTLDECDLSAVPEAERDHHAELFLNEHEARGIPFAKTPHIRAALGRFGQDDSVLVLVAHHMAVDGWSIRILVRDLAILYAVESGLQAGPLPYAYTYTDYAREQAGAGTGEQLARARGYWREQLRGARMTVLPNDRPHTGGTDSYAVHRFSVEEGTTAALLAKAKETRCSPFIVLMAVYNTLLSRRTGQDDLTVPTFTSGRSEAKYQNTVGPFNNFLPLRTDLRGCMSFDEVLARTRATCLDAYENDVPFPVLAGEAPDLMAPFSRDDVDVVAFEVLQFPSALEEERFGPLLYTELQERNLSQTTSSTIPDGLLWAMEVLPNGRMSGSLKYNTDLFDTATIHGLVEDFVRVLTRVTGTTPALINEV